MSKTSKQSNTSMVADISHLLEARFNSCQQGLISIPDLHPGSRRGWNNFILRSFPELGITFNSTDRYNEYLKITEIPYNIFTEMYSGSGKIDQNNLRLYRDAACLYSDTVPLAEVCEALGYTLYGFRLITCLFGVLNELRHYDCAVVIDLDLKPYHKQTKYDYNLDWIFDLNSRNCGYYTVSLAGVNSPEEILQAFAELVSLNAKIDRDKSQCVFTKFPKALLGVRDI